MANFDDERPTIPIPQQCAACGGMCVLSGEVCFVCGGLGSVLDARVNQKWIEAGRPKTREEFRDI